MARYFTLLLLFGLLLSTCSNQKTDKNVINNFPPPDTLKGKQVFKDQYQAFPIQIFDSLIVVSTPEKDTLLHVYNEKHKKLASFGRKGKGPGEFTGIPILYDGFTRDGNHFAYYYDFQKLTLHELNLSASIDSGKTVMKQIMTLPRELSGGWEPHLINYDTLVGYFDDRFDKKLKDKAGLYYYYPDSSEFDTYSLFDLNIKNLPPKYFMAETNLNARQLSMAPNRQKFAIAMVHYPRLDLFTSGSATPTTYLTASNPPDTTFNLDQYKEGKVTEYYSNLYVTNNKMYLLYHGISKERRRGEHSSFIQVIDWNGNPIEHYFIPSKYSLSLIVADEANNKFYGLSTYNDAIYQFKYGDMD